MERVSADDTFPWGDPDPEGGFQVGDRVGLAYSDHEEYVFDNPTGVVTAIEEGEPDIPARITVQVEATISADRVYLIQRSPTFTGGDA